MSNEPVYKYKEQTVFKKGLFFLYIVVGIYVAAMYLSSVMKLPDLYAYSVMMNLLLSFGLFSGIFFVEANKAKRWFATMFLGVLWIAGVVVDYIHSSSLGTWGQNNVRIDLFCLLLLFVPLFVIWALSRITKGRNVIQAFVGAVFALFSLGFLPGRGRWEPLYDIFLVVMSMATFAIVA